MLLLKPILLVVLVAPTIEGKQLRATQRKTQQHTSRLDKVDFCMNKYKGNEGTDLGCTSGKPYCMAEGGIPIVENATGTVCAPCMNSDYDNVLVDAGCNEAAPLCAFLDGTQPAMALAGDHCIPHPIPCTNLEEFDRKDRGCTFEAPICVKDDDTEPGTGKDGARCAVCINNKEDPRGKDRGCTTAAPLCVVYPLQDHTNKTEGRHIDPGWMQAGTGCIATPYICQNTNPFSGADEGCNEAEPFCVNHIRKLLGKKEYGSKCAPCINNKGSDSQIDQGCTAETPRCVKDDMDTPGLHRGGHQCVPRCLNDKSADKRDNGCSQNNPVCALDTREQPANNNEGTACHPCISDGVDKKDKGCAENGDDVYCVDENRRPLLPGMVGDKCDRCKIMHDDFTMCIVLDETVDVPAEENDFVVRLIDGMEELLGGKKRYSLVAFNREFQLVTDLSNATATKKALWDDWQPATDISNVEAAMNKCADILRKHVSETHILVTVTDSIANTKPASGKHDLIQQGYHLATIGVGGFDMKELEQNACPGLAFSAFDSRAIPRLQGEIGTKLDCYKPSVKSPKS